MFVWRQLKLDPWRPNPVQGKRSQQLHPRQPPWVLVVDVRSNLQERHPGAKKAPKESAALPVTWSAQ